MPTAVSFPSNNAGDDKRGNLVVPPVPPEEQLHRDKSAGDVYATLSVSRSFLASERWRSEFSAPLKGLLAEGVVQAGFGVYTGAVELKDGPLRVRSLPQFLELLAKGDLFS